MKVLVCWEDRYHAAMDLCLRRALRHGSAGAAFDVELFFDDVRGNGGFEPYVRRDWPKLVRHGLPKSNGPVDYLVCIADADRATTCCGIEAPPPAPASTSAWIERANRAFTEVLQSAAPTSPARVLGRFLRWSQESLLIAVHDVDLALRRLGCRDLDAARAHLRACRPSPMTVTDDLFVEHYRHGSNCLTDLMAAAGASPTRKGSSSRDDALNEASRVALDRLLARVPDVALAASAIRGLVAPS